MPKASKSTKPAAAIMPTLSKARKTYVATAMYAKHRSTTAPKIRLAASTLKSLGPGLPWVGMYNSIRITFESQNQRKLSTARPANKPQLQGHNKNSNNKAYAVAGRRL